MNTEIDTTGNGHGANTKRSKYKADTETEMGIDRNLKNPLNHREIHTKTNKFNELLTWLQNNIIMLAT